MTIRVGVISCDFFVNVRSDCDMKQSYSSPKIEIYDLQSSDILTVSNSQGFEDNKDWSDFV